MDSLLNRDPRTSFIDVESDNEIPDSRSQQHSNGRYNAPLFLPATHAPPVVQESMFSLSNRPSTAPSQPLARTPWSLAGNSSSDLSDAPANHRGDSEAPASSSKWSQPSSQSYSPRSRSGSSAQHLKENPYDARWPPSEERDDLTPSEYDTEDDLLDEQEQEEDDIEEQTSAIRLAEDGTGRIVEANGMGLSHLRVEPGTTHLLLGSSPTHGMSSFLTSHIHTIASTLLVLDISANFLDALPPMLSLCTVLEELNIASNPLRVIPVFLANLANLRVLIADATGISTIPDSLVDLERLHTLSIRRNKMTSLPSWLCRLPALQALYVDSNPFQGPWEALVKPLLAQVPSTPIYPLSTPMHPLPSAGAQSATSTDTDSLSDYTQPKHSANLLSEGSSTTLDRTAPPAKPSESSPIPSPRSVGLVRTRTAPNRSSRPPSRAKSSVLDIPSSAQVGDFMATSKPPTETFERFGTGGELRKMKSAGDLRRPKSAAPSSDGRSSQNYPTPNTLANSSNAGSMPDATLPMQMRFASLSAAGSNTPRRRGAQSVWDQISENDDSFGSFNPSPALSRHENGNASTPQRRKEKEKTGRWGFLKKMSMGKMKPDSPLPQKGAITSPSPVFSRRATDPYKPLIDTRISTSGNLDFSGIQPPRIEAVSEGPSPSETQPRVANHLSPQAPSLLSPNPPSTGRTSRRRSFLPIDTPLAIPDSSAFVGGVTVAQDGEISPLAQKRSPSPDPEALLLREQERARDAYKRALRSVMAYLKDMNDLSLSQQATANVLGSPAEEAPLGMRSRRPTASEITREPSTATNSIVGSTSSDYSSQLRSVESIAAIRSGASSQTNSVAESIASNEERKWKDDKAKRLMVVREIIHTERTYVKGLQELSDIYIKPSSAPANVLGGVSSSKDTVLPAAERKAVFGGLDALFSFHKDSFLPALEATAAPLMKKGAELDPDGILSADVAKAVGNIFFKHVAFMRMYSTYINNFDNAVQRVKAWTSDRPALPPNSAISPSSSTAQLSASGGSDASATTAGQLTSSQRKRIRGYLKRCRMNPRHSQLNLEGYLLLPVQRIPRYRLLLEELVRSTPPTHSFMDDPLDRALAEISSLASNMNEGKREAESRRKLVQWQSRIRGKFPSPLVQPHRRLIMDGPLTLTRVVRKAIMTYDSINSQGDKFVAQVDCLAPELTPRPLVGILCNDLLVLCRDLSDGNDQSSPVDLWAVLRMQTLPQPASIVHGNSLRLVDNKAILYFDTPSPSEALNWYRAINLHIPASKS